IAPSVVPGREERLRVDVDAERVVCAQLHRRDGENSGAAAVVDHFAIAEARAFEPVQAHRRRRMGAGAEGETRIEPHDDGLRLSLRRMLAVRTDPKPLAKPHRLEVLEPLALPGAISDLGEAMRRELAAESRFERINHFATL